MSRSRDLSVWYLLALIAWVVMMTAMMSTDRSLERRVNSLEDVVETTRPRCLEDEALVVAPQIPSQDEDLRWVCVTLDDWADEDSMARLDAILAGR